MKIVLFALNGSYSHTNLAVRCLRRALEQNGFDVKIVERNLRDKTDDVLHSLYTEHADAYGFSAYIWNITEMLTLAADLKSLLPSTKIIFGGPEVSFSTERFSDMNFIDFIICGEGEDAIVKLCKALESGEDIPRIIDGGVPDVMKDEGILYKDGDYCESEMLYYESSRGCPYNCSYCLSSACGGIRAKSVPQTLADLESFSKLSSPAKIIKFVDRTFNFDINRANRIWESLLSKKYDGHYHFEICSSLLNEESFSIFEKMPKGKIQLEIGLQSTNEKTLAAVSRHIKPEEVISTAARIHKKGNIHVHLDLIAGLPYEDFSSFKKSFDDAYFCCDKLQLGFLKLLYGTKLREDAKKYGIICSSKPPYTVLETAYMTKDELYRLSEIADILERIKNSGAFSRSLEYAIGFVKSPFDFFSGLCDYIKSHDTRSIRKLSQTDAFAMLYGYASDFVADRQKLEEYIHEDYSERETRKFPLSIFKRSEL